MREGGRVASRVLSVNWRSLAGGADFAGCHQRRATNARPAEPPSGKLATLPDLRVRGEAGQRILLAIFLSLFYGAPHQNNNMVQS
jgi:hypothetical protein